MKTTINKIKKIYNKFMFKHKHSPYCKLCESCGEEGCCSYINCFSILIKNHKCRYGEIHLRDCKFDRELCRISYDIIKNLENGLFDKELAIKEYYEQWNRVYDKIYKDN